MRHQWDDGEWFIDRIYSTCCVCGEMRWRDRTDADSINTGLRSIDVVSSGADEWRYEGTPQDCPGDKEWIDAAA